jgi:formate-dependent nitrite reductase membrane component NrfD
VVSILHNIVHLLFGIAGLAMARTAAQARTYLVFGGAIYLVLFVYGLIVGQESAANFVPVNTADDFLHLILGIGMIGLGLALTRERTGVGAAR